jgi:hypothetical protein
LAGYIPSDVGGALSVLLPRLILLLSPMDKIIFQAEIPYLQKDRMYRFSAFTQTRVVEVEFGILYNINDRNKKIQNGCESEP